MTTLLKNKIQLNTSSRSYGLYLTIHGSGSTHLTEDASRGNATAALRSGSSWPSGPGLAWV